MMGMLLTEFKQKLPVLVEDIGDGNRYISNT